jgi:hypothetical protein
MIKLHGIAKPVKVEHEHQHQHMLALDRMPMKELMEMADMEDLTLEGEFQVVESLKRIGNDKNEREVPN